MSSFIKVVLPLYFLWLCNPLNGQILFTGQITDGVTNEALAGVTIVSGDYGTETDENGNFTLELEHPSAVTIAYLGYHTQTLQINETSDLKISLQEKYEVLDATTITASKFEQRLSESTVSVEVIKPSLLRATNTTKADDIVNKIPGVQMVGGQANIRGGSGFSYGAGSRVMLLVDELPALQVDAGYANWGDLPVEILGQMEIIKGASSSLYGSSALNGILHFRREQPTTKAKTNIFTSGTYFMDPKEPLYKSWGDKIPYRANLGFSHLNKKNKLGYAIHGFLSKYDSYAAETYENRLRLGNSLQYQISKKAVIGVNTLFNFLKSSDYFIWRNALRGIYEPFAGTVSSGKRSRINIDPYFKYYGDNGFTHKVFTRYFYTDNNNNANQQNQSSTYYGEYQLSKNFEKLDLNFIAGALISKTDSKAELLGDTTFNYINSAIYGQLDKKFFDKLTFSYGVRYENNTLKSPDEFLGFQIPNGKTADNEIISRLGINYALMEYSSIRASWGQGYRFPTVTERFISTLFGGFQIFPNPALRPEYGWTSELAIKQGIKISSFKGFIDLAAFVSEYEDMIEFTFLENPYGFKPINIGNTRITGGEISIIGQVNVLKIPITILSGYTYINPTYKNFGDNKDLLANLSTSQNILKYRSKHSLKLDLEGTYKKLSLGFSIQKYSHMINIDKRFEAPLGEVDLFAIKVFRDQNNGGYTLLDGRLSLNLKNYKIGLIMGNIANQAYTVRPGLLEAPRNISLRLDYQI